jgi:hypothetical protein
MGLLGWIRLDRRYALELKADFFSRIFIFSGQQNRRLMPFFVVNIDNEWLNNLREQD